MTHSRARALKVLLCNARLCPNPKKQEDMVSPTSCLLAGFSLKTAFQEPAGCIKSRFLRSGNTL
jgi:hypothetical protein